MVGDTDAELERAMGIAVDALELLLSEDRVLLYIEGELNLPDGAIEKAYKTLHKVSTQSAKPPKIDREEVFYSIRVEDIFMQAQEMGIPKKKLTSEALKQIIRRIEGSLEDTNLKIQDAIKDEIPEGGL